MKYKIEILFGHDAVKAWEDGMSKKKAAEEFGELVTKEFNSDEARDAYIQGLNDAYGWEGWESTKIWETKK